VTDAPLFIGWSIGGGYGHLAQLAPIVHGLRRGGANTLFALPDPTLLDRFPNSLWGPRVAAPPPPPSVAADQAKSRAQGFNERQISYADILRIWGFQDAAHLALAVAAWDALLAQSKTRAVICHHAPALQAAALKRGLPTLRVGDGFIVPPATTPLATIPFWLDVPETARLATEAPILDALHQSGLEYESVGAFLASATDYLITWPHLDHYGARQDAYYYGPMVGVHGTAIPDWPAKQGRKVLAYLSADHPDAAALCEAVDAAGASMILHMPRPPAIQISKRVTFSAEPLNFAALLADADVLVCHTPHATSAIALQQGKPVLALPLTLEQEMIARRLSALGVAVMPEQTRESLILQNALHQACEKAGQAQLIAQLVKGYDAAAAADELTEDILDEVSN
jgi:hypothetical protein